MHERTLDIDTGEGLMETLSVIRSEATTPDRHPVNGRPGIRDELAHDPSLASAGYFVLLPNL